MRYVRLVFVAVLGLVPSGASAQTPTVVGEVTYSDAVSLPASAMLELSLEDVSRAGQAGEVVSRLTQRTPGGSPIPFDLPFDETRIDPTRRYAVRAEIRDRGRVLLAAPASVVAVTQGRARRVAVPVRLVNAPVAESTGTSSRTPTRAEPTPEASLPALRPLPRVVELGVLPAVFAGTLACADCPSRRVELTLFADESFFLTSTRAGAANAASTTDRTASDVSTSDLGSWVLSSDRRVLVLRGARGTFERFAIETGGRLRVLDALGQPRPGAAGRELRRRASLTSSTLTGDFTGAYVTGAGTSRFVECSTGQSWPLAGDTGAALEKAARTSGLRLGGPPVVTVRGTLSRAAKGEASLSVESVERVERSGGCAPRFSALALGHTRWTLATPTSSSSSPAVMLTFRPESGSFAGASGCHQVTGRFAQREEAFSALTTGRMKSCGESDKGVSDLANALAATRRFRVSGAHLEFYDADQKLVARFEGK